MRGVTVALLMLLTTAAGAQETVVYERLLLPLYGLPVVGAHGSRWNVESWVHYTGVDLTAIVPRLTRCDSTCSSFYVLWPGNSPVPIEPTYHGTSLLLYVDTRIASAFQVASRVRDLSRGVGMGTEVPAIRERQMVNAPVDLLNVPLLAGSRNALRLYALPDVSQGVVEVRYFRMPVDVFDERPELLRTDRVALHTPATPLEFMIYPASASVDFGDLPELAGRESVWLEIVPVTPGLRIWAMASVTDNATQQVTLVTPTAR